jgi:hypothetical protein
LCYTGLVISHKSKTFLIGTNIETGTMVYFIGKGNRVKTSRVHNASKQTLVGILQEAVNYLNL